MYYDPSGLQRKVIPFCNGPFKYSNINGINYNKLLRSYIGEPPEGMIHPHAHHVAYKQGFGSEQQALVSDIQDMLVNDFGIDPIKGKEVLCWAPNVKGQHNTENLIEIIYVFLTIFLYLLKCPQSLILSALRAFCFCGKSHIPRSIFLYFRYQSWLKSW